MPLFEYQCRGCGREFEAFVTSERAAVCPACDSRDLQKRLSSPGMVGVGATRQSDVPACRAQGGRCACNPDLN